LKQFVLTLLVEFFEKPVKSALVAIPLFQPNMRWINSLWRRVPECASLVAPRMGLTINPLARSTELYQQLEQRSHLSCTGTTQYW